MGAVQGFLATSGPGALIGALLGWIAFDATAVKATNCVVADASQCLEAFGMSFIPFTTLFAAIGGLIGLIVLFVKGDILQRHYAVERDRRVVAT